MTESTNANIFRVRVVLMTPTYTSEVWHIDGSKEEVSSKEEVAEHIKDYFGDAFAYDQTYKSGDELRLTLGTGTPPEAVATFAIQPSSPLTELSDALDSATIMITQLA